MKIKPITPNEIVQHKFENLPDSVIEVFNLLIAQSWDGTKAIVEQRSAANLIAKKLDITQAQVYEKKLLDVEEVYRKAGWVVMYDKPAYCESYEATFTFKRKGVPTP